MDEASDPKIVSRLGKFPPYEDENDEVVETPVDPTEETETEEPKEEVEEEIEKVEVEEEAPVVEKDRTTEQFEKLKQHNAELKKQLEESKPKEPIRKNALDALIPENQPTTNVIPSNAQFPDLTNKEIKDVFANLTDDQGYVDTGLLKETLSGLQQRALDAEKRAKVAENSVKSVARKQDDFERKQVMREVHEMYPKLNPENANSDDPNIKFDDSFYDLFQGEIIRRWTSVGNADPMEVAGKISGILYKNMTKADKEKAEKAELAKRNINATSARPSSQRESYTDHDELVKATMMGKKGALAERLKRAGQ